MKIKQILLYVSWLGVIMAAGAANRDAQGNQIHVVVIALWSVFSLFACTALVLAILTSGNGRGFWIGCSIFSLAALIIFTDIGPGFFGATIGEEVAYYFSNELPQISSPFMGGSLDAEEQSVRNILVARRENFGHLIDLFAASLMAMAGGAIGSWALKRQQYVDCAT